MNQEEKVVAVTGDDKSGHLTSADPAVGAGPAAADGAVGSVRDDGTDNRDGLVAAGPDAVGEASAADEESAANQADTPPGGEPSDESGDEGDEADTPVSLADLEQESEIAADYVEGLLDVADLDGDIDMDVEGDRPVVSVVGATLEELVGPHGEVLEALQELTRLAVHRQTGTRSRIMLDVGGYRARRRAELSELARSTAEEVSRTGVARRLQAMTPFERKVVHDAVAAAGLRSESEGEEPDRRVVVFPAG